MRYGAVCAAHVDCLRSRQAVLLLFRHHQHSDPHPSQFLCRPCGFREFSQKRTVRTPAPAISGLSVMFSRFLMLFRFEPLGMSSALIQTDSKGLFVMSSFGQVVIRAYFTSTILVIRCRYANICDWVSFGALYARNGRTLSGRQILTEEWIAMTTAPNEFAEFGERC